MGANSANVYTRLKFKADNEINKLDNEERVELLDMLIDTSEVGCCKVFEKLHDDLNRQEKLFNDAYTVKVGRMSDEELLEEGVSEGVV